MFILKIISVLIYTSVLPVPVHTEASPASDGIQSVEIVSFGIEASFPHLALEEHTLSVETSAGMGDVHCSFWAMKLPHGPWSHIYSGPEKSCLWTPENWEGKYNLKVMVQDLMKSTSEATVDSYEIWHRWGEPGDIIWCAPSGFNIFGHIAFYVGPRYDPVTGKYLGDAIQRRSDLSGWLEIGLGEFCFIICVDLTIRVIFMDELPQMVGQMLLGFDVPQVTDFVSLNALKKKYPLLDLKQHPRVPKELQRVAADYGADITYKISNGQPGVHSWYTSPYNLYSRACPHFVMNLFFDVGATMEQVGDPHRIWHPEDFFNMLGGIPRSHIPRYAPSPLSPSQALESSPLWLNSAHLTRISDKSDTYSLLQILESILPTEISTTGERARYFVPEEALSLGQAIDAAGVAYENETSKQSAEVVIIKTQEQPYIHDYSVCRRFMGSEINLATLRNISGGWFWILITYDPITASYEYAIPLCFYGNEDEVFVNSVFKYDDYKETIHEPFFNTIIRANSYELALALLASVIQNVNLHIDLKFANTTEIPDPDLLVRKYILRGESLHITLDNRGPSRLVKAYGTLWTEPDSHAEHSFEWQQIVPEGIYEVSLPVGTVHDLLLNVSAGTFVDKIYAARGKWYSWNDNPCGTSLVNISNHPLENLSISGAVPSFVSPPALTITGLVTDQCSWAEIGAGYMLSTHGAFDIGTADTLAFFVKGDGRIYRVRLETGKVLDFDFHGKEFIAPHDSWTLIKIPLMEFIQNGWGVPVDFNATDIRTIAFCTVGRPIESVKLTIDRISFISEVESDHGLESDVAPRFHGDSQLLVNDWVQVGRFLSGLDIPAQGSEFQRADCAPLLGLGDGQLLVNDWVQAGRYVLGLDAPQQQSGPIDEH